MSQTPEERRDAQALALALGQMSLGCVAVEPNDFEDMTSMAGAGLDGLLAYFDKHEPAIADAIRYGLKEVVPVSDYGCDVEITKAAQHHLVWSTTGLSTLPIQKLSEFPESSWNC